MSCTKCEKARKAQIAERQAQGKSTGKWSVTTLDGTRLFFDNKLAAMAYAATSGDSGAMVRQVT